MTFSLAARRTQRQVICATLLCLTVLQELEHFSRQVHFTSHPAKTILYFAKEKLRDKCNAMSGQKRLHKYER